MLPYPIDPLSSLILQVSGIKISAQKQDETNMFSIIPLYLGKFRSFFLASFICVSKVTSRFCFNQKWKISCPRVIRHNNSIYGNVYLISIFQKNRYIQAK